MTEHLHVVANDSAAGNLKMARREGLIAPGTILATSDQMECGPIQTFLRPKERETWFRAFEVFPAAETEPWPSQFDVILDDYWNVIFASKGPTTVWWSSLSSAEWTMMLLIVRHAKHLDQFQFVDASEIPGKSYISVGELAPEELKCTLPLARRLSDSEVNAARQRFDLLAQQAASVRFIADGILVGGPVSTHDWMLRKNIKSDWTIARRIIGGAEGEQCYGPSQTRYWFLFQRLLSLHMAGEIELRGKIETSLGFEVRWPS